MGPALQAAFMVMSPIGGKLLLFQSAVPSLGAHVPPAHATKTSQITFFLYFWLPDQEVVVLSRNRCHMPHARERMMRVRLPS